MNRLESWGKSGKIHYPEDVKLLKESIVELSDISDMQIQIMYEFWSEEYFCAGWVFLSDGTISAFKKWLLQDLEDMDILW